MVAINEAERVYPYKPRVILKELGEGVVEVKCHTLDCVHNDRTRYESGKFGFCNCDELEWGGKCHNYQMDAFYMAYTLHEDVKERKHMKRKEPRTFKNGGGWVES